MPAKSKAQQKFMGMVHAAKKGEKPASKEVAAAAKGMTKKAAKDFAGTKHKGLPEKVKKSKTEESLLNDFEQAISEVTVTSGPNKGKQWSPKTPGPTNKNYKEIDGNIPSPPDGATAPPPGYKPPKSMKKAEVTTSDDAEMTSESSTKKVMKQLRAKHLYESMQVLGKLIAEAKKAKKKDSKVEEDPNEGNAFGKAVSDAKKDGIQKGEKVKVGGKEYPVKESAKEKCNHTPKGKKCPVHGLKECGSMYEGAREARAPNDTPRKPFMDPKSFDTQPSRPVTSKPVVNKQPWEKDEQDLAVDRTRDASVSPTKIKETSKNDGNLANNAKPYDKVTRGDVIAGRLGKDEMGGKKKKTSKATETFMPKKPKTEVPQPTDLVKDVVKKGVDKFIKPKSPSNLPKTDTPNANPGANNKTSKDAWEPSDIADVNEGWTHDTLAAQLFESGDEYVVSLHNKLAKQLKG